MKQNITVADWLKIDKEKKQALLEQFKIHKSGCMEVMDGKVICDGVTEKDLLAFNIGAMAAYLGDEWLPWVNEKLCDELLTLTLNKLYGGQPERKTELRGESTIGSDGSIETRIVGIHNEGDRNPIVGTTDSNDTPDPETAKPRRGGRPRKTT